MSSSGARDRSSVDAVEGPRGRSTFDGNHPVVSWLIGQGLRVGEDLHPDDLEILKGWLERGHIAWVVIPN